MIQGRFPEYIVQHIISTVVDEDYINLTGDEPLLVMGNECKIDILRFSVGRDMEGQGGMLVIRRINLWLRTNVRSEGARI